MTYIEESNDALTKQLEIERAEKQQLQKELEESRGVIEELHKKSAKNRMSQILSEPKPLSAPSSPSSDFKADEDKLETEEKRGAVLLDEYKQLKAQHEVTLKDLEKERARVVNIDALVTQIKALTADVSGVHSP